MTPNLSHGPASHRSVIPQAFLPGPQQAQLSASVRSDPELCTSLPVSQPFCDCVKYDVMTRELDWNKRNCDCQWQAIGKIRRSWPIAALGTDRTCGFVVLKIPLWNHGHIDFFLKMILLLCASVHTCMECVGVCMPQFVEGRRQLCGISYRLLPLCDFRGLKSSQCVCVANAFTHWPSSWPWSFISSTQDYHEAQL